MKKQLCVAALASAISMPSMADFLGVYAGIDYRTTATSLDGLDGNYDDTNNLSGYVAFEHFIPVLPNVKVKVSDLSTDVKASSESISSSSHNGILYYELFDNGLFEFDFGLAYTHVKSDYNNQSADLGQAYGAAKVHIPGVGMNVFAEVIGGSLTDDDSIDAEAGLAYTFNPDSNLLNFSVRMGYRHQEASFNKNQYKIENKGLFAGLEAHF